MPGSPPCSRRQVIRSPGARWPKTAVLVSGMMISQVQARHRAGAVVRCQPRRFSLDHPADITCHPGSTCLGERPQPGPGACRGSDLCSRPLADAGYGVGVCAAAQNGPGPVGTRAVSSASFWTSASCSTPHQRQWLLRAGPGLPGRTGANDKPKPSNGDGLSERIPYEVLEWTELHGPRRNFKRYRGQPERCRPKALDVLIGRGMVSATAPPRSPSRRYRRTRLCDEQRQVQGQGARLDGG